MRSSGELRDFAMRYPTSGNRGLSNLSLRKLPFENIAAEVKSDEDVILAFGAGTGSVGKTYLQYIACAITTKRMLICGKPNSLVGSFMAPGIRSIKLDKVNSTGIFGQMIRIDTLGDEDISLGTYDSSTRTRLARAIAECLDQYHSASSAQVQTIIQTKSPVEQIKEFKELLDMGVISQEEFEAKKKEILGL